ncbi:transferrin-binding protein-like solute binding protein, partial [Neisseria meningitidis]|nr:transferrin-binding protein-like solute binding protein [Neisseria meningitidis]
VETNGDSKIYTSPYLSQNADSSHANGAHQPKNEVTDYKNFKYVYSGWFYKHAKQNFNLQNNIAQQGDDGYIFYHGKEPSRQLPAFGKVTYKGVWNFVTDKKKGQEFREIIQPSKKQGDRYSGFSGDDNEEYSNKNEETLQNGHEGYGFTSNLEVDFGNKKLTGKLIRNNVSLNNNNDKHTTQYY